MRNTARCSQRCFFVAGLERWPSGLRHTLAKRAIGKLIRGFESLSLRKVLTTFVPEHPPTKEKPVATFATVVRLGKTLTKVRPDGPS